jgi:hypothetical protein
MWKKPTLLVLIMFAQLAFLFIADRNFQQGVKDHAGLMRETLPAKGVAPNQIEALAGVMDDMAFEVASHVRIIAWLLITFNFVGGLLALPKRE